MIVDNIVNEQMTKIMLYYRDHIAEDGSAWGEIRVSIVNRFDHVIKDISYEDFKQMKGYSQVRLQNTKLMAAVG